MGPIWLDTLSEDWKSSHGSSTSSELSEITSNHTCRHKTQPSPSRIPKFISNNINIKENLTQAQFNVTSLTEKKLQSLTHTSKSRNKTSGKVNDIIRPLSASSNSTQYSTINRKQRSHSENDDIEGTPEWRKRLLNKDVPYGERQDLFSGPSLENIFKAPSLDRESRTKVPIEIYENNRSKLPSSLPQVQTWNIIKNQVDVNVNLSNKDSDSQKLKTLNPVNDFSDKNSLGTDAVNLNRNKLAWDDQTTTNEQTNFTSQSVGNDELDGSIGQTVSGQSVSRNEQLSQIFLTKHFTGEKSSCYAVTESSNNGFEEFSKKIEGGSSTSPNKERPHFSNFDSNPRSNHENYNPHEKSGSIQKFNLPEESPPQKRQQLATVSLHNESDLLTEESMLASTPKNLQKDETYLVPEKNKYDEIAPKVPQTPYSSPIKAKANEVTKKSTSPLKIFGTHNTFTSERVLRRLNQFESEVKEKDCDNPNSPGHGSRQVNFSKDSESPERNLSSQSQMKVQQFDFRARDPNDFPLVKEASHISAKSYQYQDNSRNSNKPTEIIQGPTKNHKLCPSALENNLFLFNQNPETSNSDILKQPQDFIKIISSTITPIASDSEDFISSKKRNGGLDGKRSPKTPLKHPESKRRRTLHMVEMNRTPKQVVKTECKTSEVSHQHKYFCSDKETKEFKQEIDLQAENIKPNPKILKPEKKSDQKATQEKIKSLKASLLSFLEYDQDHENTSSQNGQSIAELIETCSNKKSSNDLSQNSQYEGSVTTEDFLNEASKIMACLRGRARPYIASSGSDNSHSEIQEKIPIEKYRSDDVLNDSYQESTQEPFSRPPSREGAAPIPRPSQHQDNPQLLDHLRKYQENFDLQDVLVSSLRSIAEVKEVSEIAKEIDRLTEEKIFKFSVRRASVFENAAEKFSASTLTSRLPEEKIDESPHMPCQSSSNQDNFPSLRSNTSSGQWIPTGFSKESDYRRVIAPESVSHLIPKQLAGMVFDRELKSWVNTKFINCDNISLKHLNQEVTEDDPFGDIPDLSIDETLERERIQQVVLKKNEPRVTDPIDRRESKQDSFAPNNFSENKPSANNDFKPIVDPYLSPGPIGGAEIHPSSQKQINIAKSLNEENKSDLLKNSIPQSKSNSFQIGNNISYSKVRPGVSEADDEISINHDRINPPQSSKKRNITILFSSPIASFIDCKEFKEEINTHKNENNVRDFNEGQDVAGNKNRLLSKSLNCQRSSSTEFIPSLRVSRKQSVHNNHFSARLISRIDEKDEDSRITHDENQSNQSFSIVLANNKAPIQANETYTTPQPSREIGTLTLTPLSDFTFHQVDESLGLDVSYLAQNRRSGVGNTKKALSLSIKDLVEKITEIEPYEPFWEHLKEISLKGKRLKNVHKLDNFCQRLTELDISHNQISYLDGVPNSLQIIRITNNCLSDMTAWGHLTNLQYIDVSSNNLESLSSLRCLVHLRSLRADNNKITSLKGIDQLSSLLILRLRNNFVCNLDFHNTKLQLLTDLDLRNNQVSSLQNIQQLRSLAHLDLVNNCLDELSVNNSEAVESIKYLRLSGNNLESINVGHFPNLRLLYLDRNCLGKVTGLLKTKYLDSLSLREQRNSIIHPSVISEAFEVRKLFLSGNFLRTFKPENDFLNLQLLEMANCGLELLPEGFGSMLANIRVLNLNFNSLTNIEPISGIIRLKRLHLAGNRLIGLDGLGRILSQLPTLSLVDIRSNPLTQGFYSPILVRGVNPHDPALSDLLESQDPYTLGKMDRTKDQHYESCLDMRTRMKRRIYEMSLIRSSRIKILDGLPVDKSFLFTRDVVYNSMVESGFIAPSDFSAHKTADKSDSKSSDFNEASREVCRDDKIWQAEDSFG